VADRRPHRILRPARLELRAAARKYEHEREGLGQRFALAVDEAVKDVVAHPVRWPLLPSVPKELGVHHRNVDDFPFQVLYRVLDGDLVEVVAIKHMKRHPHYWASRLRSGPRR
jgi:plasmid stabilization system protein ParE